MPNSTSTPSQEPANHCALPKARGPDAAAASHHTMNTSPNDQATPVMRCMMDSDDDICSMS